MGLKRLMAAFAASRGPRGGGGLFVPVKLNEGKPFPFAQVIFANDDESDVRHALRYPYGELGYLMLSMNHQLEIIFVEEFPWAPTELQMHAIRGTLEPSGIVFHGTHQVRDIPEEEFA